MKTPNENDVKQWLDLEVDGALDGETRALLARHGEGLEQDREALERLHALLAGSRVPVPEEFTGQVMAALPRAVWESKQPRSWLWPAALIALLGGIASALIGTSTAQVAASGSLAGALVSVWQLLATAAVTGGGLLGATWTGAGLALGELFSGSPVGWVVFACGVLSLDLLFLSMLRRPAVREAAAHHRRD